MAFWLEASRPVHRSLVKVERQHPVWTPPNVCLLPPVGRNASLEVQYRLTA